MTTISSNTSFPSVVPQATTAASSTFENVVGKGPSGATAAIAGSWVTITKGDKAEKKAVNDFTDRPLVLDNGIISYAGVGYLLGLSGGRAMRMKLNSPAGASVQDFYDAAQRTVRSLQGAIPRRIADLTFVVETASPKAMTIVVFHGLT